MVCLEVSFHVAFDGELLRTTWVITGYRADFRFRLMTTLFVSFEMGFVGVLLGTSIKITDKSFLGKLNEFKERKLRGSRAILPFLCAETCDGPASLVS